MSSAITFRSNGTITGKKRPIRCCWDEWYRIYKQTRRGAIQMHHAGREERSRILHQMAEVAWEVCERRITRGIEAFNALPSHAYRWDDLAAKLKVTP